MSQNAQVSRNVGLGRFLDAAPLDAVLHTQLEVPSLAEAPHEGRPPGAPLGFLLRGHVGYIVRHGLAEVKLCDVETLQLEGLDGVRQLLLLLRR